jgi:aspartate racemase
MKTLGVIAGIGPESTVEYYRAIISLYREASGDGSYPQFVMNSIDLRKELTFIEADDLPGLTTYLLQEIAKLARADCDFALIASNTPHLVFDELAERSAIPLLSIVETAVEEVKERGWKRPAIFGTRFTMHGTFYPKVFSREGIELIVPAADSAAYIHDKYMNELVVGQFLPSTRAGLLRVIDQLRETSEIDSVILAGTELPLILQEPQHNGIPILDTMRVHARAAVGRMLS